ncbi:tRNA (adenosine(37)-N6)-dimethylallyltransferase MiaA [Phenylobacterium sp.]|uniref:tRNA (adenosine(37)-N6)-dimethylallyltransferase MiaA n=1 Tax=Phenylobacterium sp. TaxID=1871053 RepID=UPI002730BF1C|nr:tRNA (adenosine(37)-N6)-dimethylallyltransferase MiaA [Phenylobacterium sp.]MDP1616984.1 tRNA (adenosine(37)-N6)-dimethylallyltransferase MiaA [Phenylobacterium sp.]MDP1986177.1 tRNA (adenosine(37)-N6)-dimethylallyltransferase MiaA [Phenylobacterium sp.]
MEPRIWLIGGPTASGKTAISLRLAREIGGEIVNADSIQLYGDLRILSARPTPDEMVQAPHHLFGVADGAEAWSVGAWRRAALPIIADIRSRGLSPILVGGTGLYFRSLTHGLADIPAAPPETRARAEGDFEALGEVAFRTRLGDIDPAAAARIAPGDRQRLVRAWEVYLAAGRSLSDLQAATTAPLAANDWRSVVVEPPRETLYARCDARLAAMFDAGAADEVSALVARRLEPTLPVMKALGLREIAAWQAGEMTRDEALAAAQQETRRYAKRQATWFRNQTPDWPRISATTAEDQWRQFLALSAP